MSITKVVPSAIRALVALMSCSRLPLGLIGATGTSGRASSHTAEGKVGSEKSSSFTRGGRMVMPLAITSPRIGREPISCTLGL